MGISSADRGISTVLNLFSILSLPLSPEELDNDISIINRNVQDLVPKLFLNYEREKAPNPSNGGPVEIVSYLMIDHIEEMNEYQQSLTFHGTLILNWLDERLAWEPRDFGQLDKLSFTGFDLSRFWSPGVTVKGLTMPSKELAMFHNTAYTLTYTGHIFAEMSITVKAACRLDLSKYPNDNQTCFVMVFTPIYQTARVTFTASSTMLSKNSLFGNENKMTMTSGFEIKSLDSQRFFAYSKGFTLNQSEADLFSSLTNTVLRYQIHLNRRNNGLYTLTVSLPIFCITIMSFISIFVQSIHLSLIWLFFCLALLILQNLQMSKFLPQDFDSEPLCIRISRFLLFEYFILFIYRIWYEYKINKIKNQTIKLCDLRENSNNLIKRILPKFIRDFLPISENWIIRINEWIKWILLIEIIVIIIKLF